MTAVNVTMPAAQSPAQPASPGPSGLPAIAASPDRSEAVTQVFSWIIAGASQHEIDAAIEKLWPGTKSRPLIVAAMKRISAAAKVDLDSLYGFCLEATRTLYQRAIEAGDHSTALKALKQLYVMGGEPRPRTEVEPEP